MSTFDTVDVDAAVIAAGGSLYDPHPLRALANADGEYDGVWRRLNAALTSIARRADANACLNIAEGVERTRSTFSACSARGYRMTFSWHSLGGCWSNRAWLVTGTLVVEVDSYLATRVSVSNAELYVVGRTGASRFVGEALNPDLGRAVRQTLADIQARALVDENSRIGGLPLQDEPNWSPEAWAEEARQQARR